jgi:hypothetical protein
MTTCCPLCQEYETCEKRARREVEMGYSISCNRCRHFYSGCPVLKREIVLSMGQAVRKTYSSPQSLKIHSTSASREGRV